MNVDFYVHGVPEGQDIWGVDKDREYIKSFYAAPDVKETVRFVVEIRNGNVCFYTYLRYKNIIAENNRAGSYFGMSLRFEGQYCKDVANLYKLFDQVYERFVVGSIIERVGEKERFTMSSFRSKESEIKKVQNIMIEQLDKSFAHDFVQLDDSFVVKSTNQIKTYNVVDTNCEAFFSDLKTYSKIYVSSEYPTKDYRINNAKALQEQAVSKAKAEVYSQIENKEAEIEALKRSANEHNLILKEKDDQIVKLQTALQKEQNELQTALQNGRIGQQHKQNNGDNRDIVESIRDSFNELYDLLKKKSWMDYVSWGIAALCLVLSIIMGIIMMQKPREIITAVPTGGKVIEKPVIEDEENANPKIMIDGLRENESLKKGNKYTVRIQNVGETGFSWKVRGAQIVTKEANKDIIEIKVEKNEKEVEISCNGNDKQLDKITLKIE